MPELPEVETTRCGIMPHISNRRVIDTIVHNPSLRWPIPDEVSHIIGQKITTVGRRAKYLLLQCEKGTLIIHLGMSGSLRICDPGTPLKKHDHFSMRFENNIELRLHDPRRFGAVLWHIGDIEDHPLLAHLGPEPLGDNFHTSHLHLSCQKRKTSIKQHIMNGKIVVGVGNIYACEALFRAGIHPSRQAGRISRKRLEQLTHQIRNVLSEAIAQGGTTLRDFLNQDGEPGYFKQQLFVYDRENLTCRHCSTPIKKITISNRSTYYCPSCQT